MAKRSSRDKSALPVRIFRTDLYKCDCSKLSHHTAIEISCVVSGRVKLVTPRGKYDIDEGDSFCVSPGEAHSLSAHGDRACVLTLHFEPYYIWTLSSGFSDTSLLDSFLGKSRPDTNKVCRKLCKVVTDNLLAIESESKEQKVDYMSAIKVHIASVLLALSRGGTGNRSFKMSESRDYNLSSLKTVMEYMDSNIEKDIDLDSLAQLAGMSKTYFCTVFKRYNGLKPWDYITIKRIDKALWLLSLSAEKKASIARDCGFNNSANFYRAFKKITGRTPGDYEKSY